ncbi:MAG TPA: FAD-binding oxidoreductase [Acidimicrobiales bacterium]|jgi:alkyldihydroxyacetonephosphate synthase|nr:FAD-binding oxidoreductase [Acidimicrobiales bacterium]
MRRRSWWGWGWEDEALTPEQSGNLAAAVAARLGVEVDVATPPALSDIGLPPPRVHPPDALARLCSTDPYDRASHTYGKSFRDIVRGFAGDFDAAPSFVAYPESEADVVALLDWCADTNAHATPYGGGSSVVGGVECAGAVSIDMTRMDRVLEIDRVSRAARIQAGALGPVLEEQLRPEGYTLRHYPQSFEFSTLGGWLATRSGGHFATNYTHIDDFCQSLRVVTPAGISESRRLPGSGAGPSPDRLFLGSEGTLGIITEAWMRMQDRPVHKASAGVRFGSFTEGAAAARAIGQAALFPANCRLLDPGEAMTAAGVTTGEALLVLGFESADHPVDAWMARAVELVQDHGGTLPEGVRTSSDTRPDAAGAWRGSFLRAPYSRDALVAMGMVVETFETAVTWDRFGDLHGTVTAAVEKALAEVCGGGWVTCRFTHVYPDGPAPYFSVIAPGRRGSQIAMWDEVKSAASEALLAAGGTITHHHAVGRDHRPWYDRQRPEPFAAALRAAKSALDPAGVLNPGVLFGS